MPIHKFSNYYDNKRNPNEIIVPFGTPPMTGYQDVGIYTPTQSPIVVAPQIVIENHDHHRSSSTKTKVQVTKSRSQLYKDAQDVIAVNRQKYEGTILEYEGKLDRLMAVFDARKNDVKSQNQKRQVIDLVDTAREWRQKWVNKLDATWEAYEAAYAPLNADELALFEAAIARAEAPMDVQDRGISLLGGEHVSIARTGTSASKRAASSSSTRLLEPSSAAGSTQRSIATGYSKPQGDFSTAVSSNFSRATATSRAPISTARSNNNSTARPSGARVAETGSLSRRGSLLAPSEASASTRVVSSKHAPSRAPSNARTSLLKQATTAAKSARTGTEGVVHVSAPKSTRR